MEDVHQLPKLRPLGRSEQLSAVAHHLGFFQNVGLSAHYFISKALAKPDLPTLIRHALARVISKHNILTAIPVDEDSPEVYWARLSTIDLARCVDYVTRSQPITNSERDDELDNILQEQHNTDFKRNYGALPFWRLVILRDHGDDLGFTASFIYYHGIGDGAAGVIFHRFFCEALNAVLSSESMEDVGTLIETSSDLSLLPTLEQLHPLPLNQSPVDFRTKGLQEWTGAPISLPSTTHYRSLYLSPSTSTTLAQRCKANKLTVTAGLHALLAGAMFDALPPTTEALTGIIPINLRPWLDLPKDASRDAIGSFIDAIKIQIPKSHYNAADTLRGLTAARHTSDAIAHYLTGNPSPSGEPFTSVAFFKLVQDVAVAFSGMVGTPRDAAFEISNLGRFEGAEGVDEGAEATCRIGRMTFSRSTVAFGAALNTSVVSGGDGGLSIGFSWQEGVLEDEVVERVVEGFRKGFEGEGF